MVGWSSDRRRSRRETGAWRRRRRDLSASGVAVPIIGRVGDVGDVTATRPASGASPRGQGTHGSSSSGRLQRPVGTGDVAEGDACAVSTAWIRLADVAGLAYARSDAGHSAGGQTGGEDLGADAGSVPTRSSPVRPGQCRSRWRRADAGEALGRGSADLSGCGEPYGGGPGPNRGVPTCVSRVATCGMTADWV